MRPSPTTSIGDAVVGALIALTAVVVVALIACLPWLEHPAVVPMTVATAALLVGPLARDSRDGRLDLTEPLTLAVWTQAFWHFVVGAAAFAFGRQDQVFYLALLGGDGAVVVMQVFAFVGFAAIGVAARNRSTTTFARRIAPHVPRGPTAARDLVVLTATLLVLGTGATVIGYARGGVGYSAVAGESTGAAWSFLAMLPIGAVITAAEAVRAGASRRVVTMLAGCIAIAVAVQAGIAGNRGTVIAYAVASVIALARLGRRYDRARLVGVTLAGVLVLGTSVVYGSLYRTAATAADGTVSDDLIGNTRAALSELWDLGPEVLTYGGDRLVERLDSLASASIVVERYEELREAEAAAGTDGEIVGAALGALVPRELWPTKPSADPELLGELYFGYRNAYATTPFTTLVRNYGPWSIAIGMALVGWCLGVFHRLLASRRSWTALRGVAYVLVTTRAVNYEASYASFFPDTTRILAVVAIAAMVAWLVARALGGGRGWGRPRDAASVSAVADGLSVARAAAAIGMLVAVSLIAGTTL